MQSPPIDPRGYDEIVAETQALAERFTETQTPAGLVSGWRPAPDGRPDAGSALIGVFGRFAELVIERLNRAPEKSYLAFLNLIGTSLLPPQPARVPLTFHLAENSPVDAAVDAGTPVAAPPLEGEEDEVPFETERDLVVHRAALQAVLVSDTEADAYADRTAQATGQIDEPFAVFSADRPSPHRLYLACDPLLTQPPEEQPAAEPADEADALLQAAGSALAQAASASPEAKTATLTEAQTSLAQAQAALAALKQTTTGLAQQATALAQAAKQPPPVPPPPAPGDVTITLQTADLWQWQNWPVTWWWWDGTAWRQAAASGSAGTRAWRVTLRGLPWLTPHTVGGVEARWLRAQLDLRLAPGETGQLPGSVGIGARNPQDLALPLEPFPADSSVKRFYLAADDAFAQAGARLTAAVRLRRPGAGSGVQLTWSYQVGSEWRQLGQSGAAAEQVGSSALDLRDGTRGLTRDGDVSFHVPMDWPRTLYRTRIARWLRVEVSSGAYTTPPEIAALEAAYDWELPRVERVTVRTAAQPAETAPTGCLTDNDLTVTDRTAAAASGTAFTPFTPTADSEPALYLGFDRPFAPRPVTLYLQVEPPRPEEVAAEGLAELDPADAAHVTWDYDGADGWRPLGAVDETQELSGRGLVRFVGPQDHLARPRFRQELWWLRARWQRGAFPLPPRLRRVLPNTTWAAQVTTVADEILGSGNGNPGLVFQTAQTPVQPGQVLLVGEPEPPSAPEQEALAAEEGPGAVSVTLDAAGQPDEIRVRWHAVADFYASGPRDRHYVLDALSGQVSFGDGVAGMVPPRGQNNVRINYRAGGGERGNRAAGTIVQLKAGIPFLESVDNHEPAQGGAAREPIERLKERGPRTLRHRDRAITAADLEDLALTASAEVARVAAIVPEANPLALWVPPGAPPREAHALVEAGRMGVVVVPGTAAARPTPSLGLLRQVKAHLERRCPPTADLWVAGPEWIAVAVTATVAATSVEEADALAERVRTTLDRFLHPLTGGATGQGWPFGRTPHRSDLFALVETVEGVDSVRSLDLALEPETTDPNRRLALRGLLRRPLRQPVGQPELEQDLRRWLERALVYPSQHEIDVALV
ncbi:MAG TPA: putative baseplate assembly protein [Actinomycetes bacterium]|nr:putative baseplate assembly protein [Actinomycetes bacterium]